MNHYKHIIFFSLFTILFSSKTSEEIQSEINKNNKTLQDLEFAIQKIEKDINKRESSKKDIEQYIEKINQRIQYREKQISILIQQNKSISELINKSKNNIEVKEKKLIELKNKLMKRSVYLYKYGRKKLVSELVLSNDWNRALNKLKYLKILLKYENELNENIKSKIQELNIEQKNLKKDKKKQQNILNDAQKIYNELKIDKKNKNNKIKEINNQKASLEKDLTIKKQEVSEIENIIKKLLSDKSTAKKREEDLAKRRASQNKSTSGNFAMMKGKLDWPTAGKVINKFGIQYNQQLNTKTENIGIDIQTNNNEPVYSVLDGVVSYITFLRNYGNTIIISHGGGYFSVYSNIENISVSENDYILSNIQIATTKRSENPKMKNKYILHFEIWKNETKLNPENWLKK